MTSGHIRLDFVTSRQRGWWVAAAGAATLVLVTAVLAVVATPQPRVWAARVAQRLPVLGRLGMRAEQAAPPSRVVIAIDTDHPRRAISPLIYGVSVASPEGLAATGARLNRWGGNPNSRYNWAHGSAWNSARDWYFANYGERPTAPSATADSFVNGNRAAGVQTLLTIPALGWVARNADNETRSVDVPADGGPPIGAGSESIAGYDPSANRALTSVRSLARRPPASAEASDSGSEQVYQDDWVRHLVDRFGSATAGGVAFYAIDNEPDLWPVTHTDVHPVQPSYDDTLSTFIEYADAVKDADPGAQVLGPTLSGWTSYFYSARDRGGDNFRTRADRQTHGDMPFLPWWLDQVRQHDQRQGRRSLDFLDVHYYPQAQGVFGGGTDEATNRLRLRSTRSLWDASYVDESWINQPIGLIPRLRDWIDQYYPGTRLAINEWNWGADQTMNGALAIADVLGIFGREGVDMAAYWTFPPPGSPGAQAFAMYTNYDAQGHGFGDQVLAATSDHEADVSAYGSIDSRTGDLFIMAINKRTDADLPTTLQLSGPARGQVHLFRYAGGAAIDDLGASALSDTQLLLGLPSSSITLVRFEHSP